MTVSITRHGVWPDSAIALLLVAGTIAVATPLLTAGHIWGDDWAGYLLQARSIGAGQVDAELARNAVAVDGSDVPIGPYAYPWGFPLMLWFAGTLSAWSILGMKWVGVASLGAVAASSYGLARQFLSRPIAVLAAVWIALQPALLLDSNTLGSDLPFAALSTAALWGCLLQLRRVESAAAPSTTLLCVCVALSGAGFAVRSNGAVTPCVYAAAIAIAVLRGWLDMRLAARHLVVFAVSIITILTLYFVAFPDGSLVHAGYLTLDPTVLLRRLTEHVRNAVNFAPSILFLGFWKLVPLGAALALAVYGARRFLRGDVLLVMGAYCGLHLALVTVFRFDGGVRYYYPLLAPVVIFALVGLRDLTLALVPYCRSASVALRSGLVLSAAVLSAALLSHATYQQNVSRVIEETLAGPYAAPTREAFAATLAAASAEQTIAFAKPRAFRATTGRATYAIQNVDNLGRVECYLHSDNAEPRLQVTEAALRAVADRPFRLRFRNAYYALYCRT